MIIYYLIYNGRNTLEGISQYKLRGTLIMNIFSLILDLLWLILYTDVKAINKRKK